MERLYSIKEACAELGGISRWTLYRENKAGKIKFVTLRGRKLVTRSELDRYAKLVARTAA